MDGTQDTIGGHRGTEKHTGTNQKQNELREIRKLKIKKWREYMINKKQVMNIVDKREGKN